MDIYHKSRTLSLFIDQLRYLRNLKLDDFLDGIISPRQFKRYLSGKSSMPYNILDNLSKRLGFNAEQIIMELEEQKIKQSQDAIALYNAVISKNTLAIEKYLKIFDSNIFYSKQSKLLFDHSKILYDYINHILNERATIDALTELIEFDVIITKKVLSSTELLLLVSFLQFHSFNRLNLVADRLSSYIEKEIKIVSGHNVRTLVLVLEELAKYYGYGNHYDKILHYSLQGINYSVKMRSFYLLENLYYFASYAYHHLGDFESRDKIIKQITALLVVYDDKVKQKNYQTLFRDLCQIDLIF